MKNVLTVNQMAQLYFDGLETYKEGIKILKFLINQVDCLRYLNLSGSIIEEKDLITIIDATELKNTDFVLEIKDMTYIENNDARGLLNYIDSEKDKKDDEKHNKTKKEKSKMLEINKLYSDLCKKLLKEGREVAGTKEINNMLFHLEDIENNIVTLSSRNISIPYVIGELTWYFAGINRCDFIGKFGSMWNRITDSGY